MTDFRAYKVNWGVEPPVLCAPGSSWNGSTVVIEQPPGGVLMPSPDLEFGFDFDIFYLKNIIY